MNRLWLDTKRVHRASPVGRQSPIYCRRRLQSYTMGQLVPIDSTTGLRAPIGQAYIYVWPHYLQTRIYFHMYSCIDKLFCRADINSISRVRKQYGSQVTIDEYTIIKGLWWCCWLWWCQPTFLWYRYGRNKRKFPLAGFVYTSTHVRIKRRRELLATHGKSKMLHYFCDEPPSSVRAGSFWIYYKFAYISENILVWVGTSRWMHTFHIVFA